MSFYNPKLHKNLSLIFAHSTMTSASKQFVTVANRIIYFQFQQIIVIQFLTNYSATNSSTLLHRKLKSSEIFKLLLTSSFDSHFLTYISMETKLAKGWYVLTYSRLGEILGRQVLPFRVCTSPKRDRLADEKSRQLGGKIEVKVEDAETELQSSEMKRSYWVLVS